jgi:hypothetical protein
MSVGGWRSGFHGIKKTAVENCLVLSITDLAKGGLLEVGRRERDWCCRIGGELVAEIKIYSSMYSEEGSVWLLACHAPEPTPELGLP